MPRFICEIHRKNVTTTTTLLSPPLFTGAPQQTSLSVSAETFPIAVAIESLKIFRRVVDRNIADGIAGMEHALEVIENLPAAERRAAAEVCSRGTEALVSAVRMLASVEMSHRAPPPDIDPFELGVTGYG